jgi:hypothetical protein
MKTALEKPTVLFILILLFCLLSTLFIYFGLRPEELPEASRIIIFSHPANAA